MNNYLVTIIQILKSRNMPNKINLNYFIISGKSTEDVEKKAKQEFQEFSGSIGETYLGSIININEVIDEYIKFTFLCNNWVMDEFETNEDRKRFFGLISKPKDIKKDYINYTKI